MPKILLIDDDKDFNALVSGYFSKLGYGVSLAENGRDGLAQAAAARPDIIFLDIMMPELNGIEVLRELQSGDGTGDIPVLIVSGRYIDQGMLQLFSQERNFRAFLSKPVALDVLRQRTEEALGKR